MPHRLVPSLFPRMMPPIAELVRQLRGRERSSRELVEGCLEKILDANGEGARTFLAVNAEAARAAAEAADARLRRGEDDAALLGVPVSVKDLFDVAGEVTRAGSVVLAEAPVARRDATAVRRLRDAGAVLIGRTNMTEFAYSGLGLNPHYGTPRNPYDRATGRIPGGSSSGAAVSVADGMAVAAIGTDTGGSVRIPAALCGLTGFKPTAGRVPMEGMVPLAPSLDSIGPIAKTVDCCTRVDAVLSGTPYRSQPVRSAERLRLGVLQGYVLEGLQTEVATAFDHACGLLASKGARVEPVACAALEGVPWANQFAAAEAFAWHRELIERDGARYDRHVSARIWPGAAMLAAEYIDLLRLRRELITEATKAFADFDALLLPTTPWTAPAIADLEADDEAYFEANGAMLRNTSLWNFLDGCALSLPCHADGEAPAGLMIAGMAETDGTVLRVGSAIEAVLAAASRRAHI